MYYSPTPIDLDTAARVAPALFAHAQHESRSDKYTYIPTTRILQGLFDEGFNLHGITQAIPRKGSNKLGHAKHLLRLRKPDAVDRKEAPEVIIINSHDGSCSYQVLLGLFRFACANGLIVGETFQSIRVLHKGDILQNVIDATYSVVRDFDTLGDTVEKLKSVELTPRDQIEFAHGAIPLRFDEKTPLTARQVLTTRRSADEGADVWSVFNRVQENLTRGGLTGHNPDNAKRPYARTRQVKGIDQTLKLNRGLWQLADDFANMKLAA